MNASLYQLWAARMALDYTGWNLRKVANIFVVCVTSNWEYVVHIVPRNKTRHACTLKLPPFNGRAEAWKDAEELDMMPEELMKLAVDVRSALTH